MRTLFISAFLSLFSTLMFGQIVKYKSLNYDIEKPNVDGYVTKYITTYHTIDFNNLYIKYEHTDSDGKKVSKRYPYIAVTDEGTYFRFTINSFGVKSIWVSRSPYNIEYEFASGTKYVFYEISRIQ